jgi:hypothetical protein
MNWLRLNRTNITLCVVLAMVVAAFTASGSLAAKPCHSSESECAKDQVAASSTLRPSMISSPNWAGYVATAPKGKKPLTFKTVTGTWTVPSVRCTAGKGPTYSTIWVGIGGFTQTRQEEVGTDANCTKAGKPSYYAWFELVPFLATPAVIKDKVKAGDTVTGRVKFLNPKLIQFRLQNKTEGWTFTRKVNWATNDQTTADWVVESPAECKLQKCQEASLANFHHATMRNISAVANGSSGNLSNRRWEVVPIRLVPSLMTVPFVSQTALSAGHNGLTGQAASPAGATPSKPSADGRSFSWTWLKVARGI